MIGIINHYTWEDNSGKVSPRVSRPHRSLAQAHRVWQLMERASGGACRFAGFEMVDVEAHLIG